MKPQLRETTELPEAHLLADAFERFNAASARLEERHGELQEEISFLREQLREKELEIERNARLATLGETAAAIAHEVRNPLGAMKLFLSLLKEDVKDKPGSLKLVDQMNLGIASIEHVVSNILHFTKDKPRTLVPVNLHALIREQVATLEPLHKGNATITMTAEGSPFVAGDEHGLKRAVYNLLLNALQATKYAGQISIACRELDAQRVGIVIRDNGAGIPDGVVERLFEPFVTSRNEGTGLGLAIVKRIVLQHQGTVEARNENGAVFEITLPK